MSALDKEPVKRVEKFLKNFDQNLNVMLLGTSARTALEAASSLKCDVGAIIKSLLFKTENTFTLCLIAGGLPPQNNTYSSDDRDENEIFNNFKDQAKILDPFVDFFYFDVLSSIREISIAENSIKEFNKPFLIGAHISEGTSLPSGEKLSDITKKINCKNLLGLILACVSPENFKKNINEIKSIGYPFGFKINAFKKSKFGNPNEFLGKRIDLTPEVLKNLAKEFVLSGATIIGGCCETNPSHIKAFSELK